MVRLLEKYNKEVVPVMMEKLGRKSPMSVPKIEKVVVNVGFGKLVSGKSGQEQEKIHSVILEDLSLITGQRPVLKKAKKAIAGFKTRQGMIIGAAVSLRGEKMYDFLERVISIALPRSRDFRGISQNSFDGSGNLSIGVKEHIIFPEISPEKIKFIFGFEITVKTMAKNKEEGIELLKLMGFPIKI